MYKIFSVPSPRGTNKAGLYALNNYGMAFDEALKGKKSSGVDGIMKLLGGLSRDDRNALFDGLRDYYKAEDEEYSKYPDDVEHIKLGIAKPVRAKDGTPRAGQAGGDKTDGFIRLAVSRCGKNPQPQPRQSRNG